MEDIKAYIESGILELYVLGDISAEERLQVEDMAQKYPEIKAEITEIEKSIKFFQGRYPNQKLDRIIVTGGASTLPEFPLYIANKFGVNVEIGNAWRNVSFPASRQNELLSISNHFAVACGLAERKE